MKSNVGMDERIVRMYAGVGISMLLVGQNSIWALVGLIPFITGAVGICPLYSLLGINTAARKANS